MVQDSEILDEFRDYLKNERNSSDNTIASYLRDMRQLADYLDLHGGKELQDAGEKDLNEYLDYLRRIGKSPATVARCVATFKSFYKHSFVTGRSL